MSNPAAAEPLVRRRSITAPLTYRAFRAAGFVCRALSRASAIGAEKDVHITRFTMYRRLGQFRPCVDELVAQRRVAGLVDAPLSVLSVSGSSNLCPVLGIPPKDVVEARYPQHNVLDLKFSEHQFDVVLCNQVLEHVEGDPFTAVSEMHRVLKPGGLLFLATVMLYKIHGNPSDYWRFTPEALALLCSRSGFRSLKGVGGWGNRSVPILDALGLLREPVPLRAWHPLFRLAAADNHLWPVVTWAVAER